MAFLNKLLRNEGVLKFANKCGVDTVIGLVLALGAFIVYATTLAPSLAGEEDQGELATAAYTLGNTHPTGYPLFVLMGRAFSMLPLGDLRVIVKLNLMTAVFSAAALFAFYRLFVSLLRGGALHSPHPKIRSVAAPLDITVRAAAAAATLTLAFSEQFWKNALNLEVYGLHMLFVAVLVTLFLRAMRDAAAGAPGGGRSWLLFVYATGLSFSHHMMTVLLAPAFLWLYFSVHGFAAPAWLKMLKAAPLFLLGLSAYIYLPVRAALLPAANWGHPATLHDFWLHVSGKQYKAMMFSGFDVPAEKFVLFLQRTPGVFGYVPLFVALIGLFALWRRERRLFMFTVLLFGACLFYALNYDFDDPNFYLNLHVVMAFYVGVGVLALGRFGAARVSNASRAAVTSVNRKRLALAVALLVPAFPLALHYKQLDDSDNYASEDFTKNMLGALDSGAVIITNQSQYLTSPALYLQFVEGYRRDVVVLQEGALGFYSYHYQIKGRHPGFAARYLLPDERAGNGLYDSVAFVTLYRRTIDTLLAHRDEIPVYFSPDIDVRRYFSDILSVPQGLALRTYNTRMPSVLPPHTFLFRPLVVNDSDISNIRSYYATAYVNQAIMHGNRNDTAAVIDMLQKALAVKPGFPNAARLLRWVRYGY